MTQQNSTESKNGTHGNGKRHQRKKTIKVHVIARTARKTPKTRVLKKKEKWKVS